MKNKRAVCIVFILILSACGNLVTPPPPATPTVTPAPTSAVGPAEIVQAFWSALNNQDVDTALSLASDDIQVVGPKMQFTGKPALQVNIKHYFLPGTKYVISDVVVVDDTVTYNWQVFVNDVLQTSGTGESMIVKDGKIIKWNAT